MIVPGFKAAEGNAIEQAIFHAHVNLRADITYNGYTYVFIRHTGEGRIIDRYGVNNCVAAFLLDLILKIVRFVKGGLLAEKDAARKLLRADAEYQSRLLENGIVYNSQEKNHLKLKMSNRINFEEYINELSVLLDHAFVDPDIKNTILNDIKSSKEHYKQFLAEFGKIENEENSINIRLKACENVLEYLNEFVIIDDEEKAKFKERASKQLEELANQIKTQIESEATETAEKSRKLYSKHNVAIKKLGDLAKLVSGKTKDACQASIQAFEKIQKALCQPVMDKVQEAQTRIESELKEAEEIIVKREQLREKARKQITEIAEKAKAAMPEFDTRSYLANAAHMPIATLFRLVDDVKETLKTQSKELGHRVKAAKERQEALLSSIEESKKREKESGFITGLLNGLIDVVEGDLKYREQEMLKARADFAKLKEEQSSLEILKKEIADYDEDIQSETRLRNDLESFFAKAEGKKHELVARRTELIDFVKTLQVAKENVDPTALFRKLEEGKKLVSEPALAPVAA